MLRKNKIYPIVLLTIVMLVSVVLLNLTNSFTEEKILAQQNEQMASQLRIIFPDMTDSTIVDDIFIVNANGQRIGYAFLTEGTGYRGTISILVGLAKDTTIKGISIISQSETAGLGSKITQPSFTDKFVGKQINDVMLTQDGGQIDAISGATISSRAVVEAVRTTALEKIKMLPD